MTSYGVAVVPHVCRPRPRGTWIGGDPGTRHRIGVRKVPAMSSPTVLASTIISAHAVDYLIVLMYFVVVLGIGVIARRQVSDSVDFFLSGRSLPAWVTGLAFISANLGAVEI